MLGRVGRTRARTSFHAPTVTASEQGVTSRGVHADHSGCWVQSSSGRAGPFGTLFQWPSGDILVVWASVEAEQWREAEGPGGGRDRMIDGWMETQRQRLIKEDLGRWASWRKLGVQSHGFS